MTLQEIIEDRLQKKEALAERVPILLTEIDVDSVTEEMIKRDMYRADNAKVINSIKDQISDLEKMSRKLRECNTDVSVQNKKLESYKFHLLYERRQRNV